MAEKYLTNYSHGEMSLALMSGGIPNKGPKMLQSSNGGSEKRPLSFGQKVIGPYCDQNSMQESMSSFKKPKRLCDMAEKMLERMTLKLLHSQLSDLGQKCKRQRAMLQAIEQGSDCSKVSISSSQDLKPGSNLSILYQLVQMSYDLDITLDPLLMLQKEKETSGILTKGLDEIQKKFKL